MPHRPVEAPTPLLAALAQLKRAPSAGRAELMANDPTQFPVTASRPLADGDEAEPDRWWVRVVRPPDPA